MKFYNKGYETLSYAFDLNKEKPDDEWMRELREKELEEVEDSKSINTRFIDPNSSKKGKIRLAAVHPQFIESLARCSEVSEKKGYERLNWVRRDIKCYFVDYLTSAALRHINKFLDGEDYNLEKDQKGNHITDIDVLHVENAAYNLLMIATLFRQGRKDLDDRVLTEEDYDTHRANSIEELKMQLNADEWYDIENLKTHLQEGEWYDHKYEDFKYDEGLKPEGE